MIKIFFIFAGIVSLTMGIIGIFVPILPTTPFILLAAACFFKSSKKLYNWLINNKFLGIYIRNYIKYKAVPIKSKIISIINLWIVIMLSFFSVNSFKVKLFLIFVALGISVHIILIPTLTPEMIIKERKN